MLLPVIKTALLLGACIQGCVDDGDATGYLDKRQACWCAHKREPRAVPFHLKWRDDTKDPVQDNDRSDE